VRAGFGQGLAQLGGELLSGGGPGRRDSHAGSQGREVGLKFLIPNGRGLLEDAPACSRKRGGRRDRASPAAAGAPSWEADRPSFERGQDHPKVVAGKVYIS
jgi:hypothetical protein